MKNEEIWSETPLPAFPQLLLENIKLNQFESELISLIDYLKESI